MVAHHGDQISEDHWRRRQDPDGALGVRSERFNDTTGALSWNHRHAALHPDACACNAEERGQYDGTPHKHYSQPPYACARCDCLRYKPLRPDLSGLDGLRILV